MNVKPINRRKIVQGLILSGVGVATRNLSAATARPTLADVWAGRAVFSLNHNQSFGADFGMHFLSIWPGNAQTSNNYFCYYIAPNNAPTDRRLAIGLATSRDGVRFQNRGVVLKVGTGQAWDNGMASFPGIYKYETSSWRLVYEGAGRVTGDIGLATGTDGLNWQKLTTPILVHNVRQPGDERNLDLNWERTNIGTPSLVRKGDMWYLFYHGFGRRSGSVDDCQVGVATGKDLRNLTRYPGNPIIRTGEQGKWDSGTIGRRCIFFEAPYYYMVYEGSTDQPYEKASWSSGLARSRDLLNWEKFAGNPILPRTVGRFGFDGPEWLRTPDGSLHIYFRAPEGFTARATLRFK